MALNVTTADLSESCSGRSSAAPSLVQWDIGQILQLTGAELPETYQVDFSCKGDTETVQQIGGADGVPVPDVLLERGLPITAYIVLHEGPDDRETEYFIDIFVRPRPTPTDVTPDPEQQSAIDQAIVALNAGVTRAEDAAEESERQADDSEESALKSEGFALGEQNGIEVGPDSPYYQNNSKFFARVAQQGAEESGFAWFDVNDQDGQMYVTITANLAEDVSFMVNETSGILEVTVNG